MRVLRRCAAPLARMVARLGSAPAAPLGAQTDATFHNDARVPAADPFVLHDRPSGYYYAYSSHDADVGFHFGIYRSADLVTWERVRGGALREDDPKQWGDEWFWAPEVYRNPRTRLYFLFYSARSDANRKRWFGFDDFEEPSKIGVAVARSPEGPFRNISDGPIDYFPYDPAYRDVNLIMDRDQRKPPATLEAGQRAPLGTYIPAIDPNLFFDADGRQYLYYSRNAYRNWTWDADLGRYVEESNILAVPLDRRWWNDPTGRTMPTIRRSFRNSNAAPGGPPGPRRDGYVQILSYGADPQPWENAHVEDYATTGGKKKDRRWEEGSTTSRHVHRDARGRRRSVYYMTYSANNWEAPLYGVGYAVAERPLGPWRKFSGNPILGQSAHIGMYSTGHGSIAASPDGAELFYVHHGRPTPAAEERRLYTARIEIAAGERDPRGAPVLRIDQATDDQPVPSGVAPYRIRTSTRRMLLTRGLPAALRWRVTSADGARLALGDPSNRVRVSVSDPRVVEERAAGSDSMTVVPRGRGRATIWLTYQRRLAGGSYVDVYNGTGARRHPVAVSVRVGATRGAEQS